MFYRVISLLIVISCIEIQCYVTIPTIYREAEQALRHYSFEKDHNPMIYSLLNILIYDKRAKAFINNEIIQQALNDVKKFNRQDENILRTIIYDEQSSNISNELKEHLQTAIETFFSNNNIDDYQTFNLLSNGDNHP